jgi:hypothetical protein
MVPKTVVFNYILPYHLVFIYFLKVIRAGGFQREVIVGAASCRDGLTKW